MGLPAVTRPCLPERDVDDPAACLVYTDPRRQPMRADQLPIHRVAVGETELQRVVIRGQTV